MTLGDIIPTGDVFMMGNEAAVYGALLAGCNFFAAYPITPASDIPHLMARLMPQVGGRFIQMEDELSAIAAIIGASWTGARAMTATSGPGFSLMMENLGYAYMTETPIVIVDVQRAGPSTGQAGKAGQGDVMQSRFGSHGDYEIIALSPYSAEDYLWQTIRAFSLAEKYRTPVVVLSDAVVAHLRERVHIPKPEDVHVEERKRPRPGDVPFGTDDDDLVPPMPYFGEGYNLLVTGSTHKPDGFRDTVHRDVHEDLVWRLHDKIYRHRDEIVEYEEYHTEDAEYLVITYGAPVRPAMRAVEMAREKGHKIGLFVPKTLWPSPEKRLMELRDVKKVLLVEMSIRGYRMEIERIFGPEKVVHLPKLSEVHTSGEIYRAIVSDSFLATSSG